MGIRKAYLISTIVLPSFFLACTQYPIGRMGNWDHMIGYATGGGFMWLIIVLIVGVAIYLTLQASKSKDPKSSIIDSQLDILKKRYAKGEIDTEEFDRKKKDLES